MARCPFATGTSDSDISDDTFIIYKHRAPTVEITSPNGGELLKDSVIISWTCTDSDGGELTYSLS